MEDKHGLAAADIRGAKKASRDVEEGQPFGGKIKVLVVDDEPESPAPLHADHET